MTKPTPSDVLDLHQKIRAALEKDLAPLQRSLEEVDVAYKFFISKGYPSSIAVQLTDLALDNILDEEDDDA